MSAGGLVVVAVCTGGEAGSEGIISLAQENS